MACAINNDDNDDNNKDDNKDKDDENDDDDQRRGGHDNDGAHNNQQKVGAYVCIIWLDQQQHPMSADSMSQQRGDIGKRWRGGLAAWLHQQRSRKVGVIKRGGKVVRGGT
jgi:hypothetical protein